MSKGSKFPKLKVSRLFKGTSYSTRSTRQCIHVKRICQSKGRANHIKSWYPFSLRFNWHLWSPVSLQLSNSPPSLKPAWGLFCWTAVIAVSSSWRQVLWTGHVDSLELDTPDLQRTPWILASTRGELWLALASQWMEAGKDGSPWSQLLSLMWNANHQLGQLLSHIGWLVCFCIFPLDLILTQSIPASRIEHMTHGTFWWAVWRWLYLAWILASYVWVQASNSNC